MRENRHDVEKIRLRGRAALIAGVCHTLGFHPKESLVVVGLCSARTLMGPTMRVDLPADGSRPMTMPSAIVRVVNRHADAVVVIVFCQNTLRGHVHATDAASVLGRMTEVCDVLYVTDTQVGSYQDGTVQPWSMRDAPDTLLITGGRNVLASREALCSQLDPTKVSRPVSAEQLGHATQEMRRLDPTALAERADWLYRQALALAAYGQALPEDLGADLLVALSARPVRDALLCTAVADTAAG